MSEIWDEADLVRRAQQGDQGAFSTLADRYWEPLQRWLYVLSGRDSQTDDITQDAVIRAWRNLKQIKNPATFRVWLFRIGRNLLVDRQRTARLGKVPLFEVPASGPGPLDQIIDREGEGKLAAALDRLPIKYREAYLLWTQEKWPYEQIAEVIGTTEQKARWRVCVARQLLLKELKAYLKP